MVGVGWGEVRLGWFGVGFEPGLKHYEPLDYFGGHFQNLAS